MSIIEKALGKVQGTGNRDSYDLKRIPAAPPRATGLARALTRPEVAPAAATVPVPTLQSVPEPQQSPEIGHSAGPAAAAPPALDLPRIHLDIHALRAAGMLPQAQGELALRNQFRRLKWPLRDAMRQRFQAQEWNANLIMIASALPGEGKTFTSLNLAMSLAREQDCRVVLVDADVAKGHLTALMGLSERPGLLDLLSDPTMRLEDVLVATDVERLSILPAHTYRGNAPELFASKRMEQVMAELAAMSVDQVVIFDSSPVLSTNEAQVLGRVMAQILMVVRADHTDRNAVLDAIELLERPKVSFILNQCQVTLGDDYYNSSYGNTGDVQQQ
jgi:exopolysaccharide/PEP-CTERM locus tyrosine autokinase